MTDNVVSGKYDKNISTTHNGNVRTDPVISNSLVNTNLTKSNDNKNETSRNYYM